MATLWLVHGWRTRGAYFDRLIPALERVGLEANDLDYGKTLTPFQTKVASNAAAHALASVTESGDVAIGHSNGCNVIHRAWEYGAPFRQAIYISPALNRGIEIPAEWVEAVHVFHTLHDWACRAARWLPFARWGDMGRRGATKPGYTNYDYTDQISGHSEWFKTPKWLAREINWTLKRVPSV